MAAKKMATKRRAAKSSKDVKCKMVPTRDGGKKVRRCFKNGKFVKTPKK